MHLCHKVIWIILGCSCLLLRGGLLLLWSGFLSFSWNFNSLNSLDLLLWGSSALIGFLHGSPWVILLYLLSLFRGCLLFLSAGNRPDNLIFNFCSCCGIYLSNDLLIGGWSLYHLHFAWVGCWELWVDLWNDLSLFESSLLICLDLLKFIFTRAVESIDLFGLLATTPLLLLHENWLLILVVDEEWKLVASHWPDHIG